MNIDENYNKTNIHHQICVKKSGLFGPLFRFSYMRCRCLMYNVAGVWKCFSYLKIGLLFIRLKDRLAVCKLNCADLIGGEIG